MLSGDSLTSWSVNFAWRKVIADALYSLLNPNVWSGTQTEIEDAQLETVRLIDALYGVLPVSGLIGEVVFFAGSSLPADYLDCDGTLRSRFDFPALFDVIAYTYGGSGDDFNMPDLRHRVAVGYHSGFAPYNAMGADIGALTHTLTVAEMPAHTHTVQRSLTGQAGTNRRVASGTDANTINTDSTGGGGEHNNVQPSRVFRALIRYQL